MNVQLNVIKKTKNTIVFDFENVKVSFVNAVRRTILSDVETVGFFTEDFKTSSLRVLKNTSSLHNEFLLHRLSLVPINLPEPENFNSEQYYFTLKVQNNKGGIIDVTTDDFKILDKVNNVNVKPELLFPHDSITGDPILITRLKANPGSEGEMIHIEGGCIKGSGKDNALFSPVSCASFINKIDPEKVEHALKNYVEEHTGDVEELTKKFMIEEQERHFYTDDSGEPDRFTFTIESIGVISPNEILNRALDILSKKINMFESELNKTIENVESSIVTIEKTQAVMDAYDITILNETHTLGNFLQEYLMEFADEYKIKFVGYMNPHPLQKLIVLRIALNNDATIVDIVSEITDVTKRMKSMVNLIREKSVKEFGNKQKVKRIIKKTKT